MPYDNSTEQVVIEIDDSNALEAAQRSNDSMEQVENTLKRIGDLLQDKTNREEQSYRKSQSSVDKMVQAYEREAISGKSSAEALLQKRDLLIKTLGNEREAIDRVRDAYEHAHTTGSRGIKDMITDLGTMYLSYEALKQIVMGFGVEITKAAAQVKALEIGLNFLAKSNNISEGIVSQSRQSIMTGGGFRDEDANKLLSKMIAVDVPLENAKWMAAAARNGSRIAQNTPEEAFGMLMMGAQFQNVRALRNLGFKRPDFAAGQKEYMRENGILSPAMMSEQDKMAANLETVRKASERLNGVWEAMPHSAIDMANAIDEAKDAIGTRFIPVLTMFRGAITGIADWIREHPEIGGTGLGVAALGAGALGAAKLAGWAGLAGASKAIPQIAIAAATFILSYEATSALAKSYGEWQYGDKVRRMSDAELGKMNDRLQEPGMTATMFLPGMRGVVENEVARRQASNQKFSEDKQAEAQANFDARAKEALAKRRTGFTGWLQSNDPVQYWQFRTQQAQDTMRDLEKKGDFEGAKTAHAELIAAQHGSKQAGAEHAAQEQLWAHRHVREFYLNDQGGVSSISQTQKERNAATLAEDLAQSQYQERLRGFRVGPLDEEADLIEKRQRSEDEARRKWALQEHTSANTSARDKSLADARRQESLDRAQKDQKDANDRQADDLVKIAREKQYSDQVAPYFLGGTNGRITVQEQYSRDINAAELKQYARREEADQDKVRRDAENEKAQAMSTRNVGEARVAREAYDQETRERVEASQRELQIRQKIIQMTTGPGGELAAINSTYQASLEAAQREYDITMQRGKQEEAIAGLKKASGDADLQRQQALMDLVNQRTQQLTSTIGNLFDTALFHPAGMGKGLLDAAKGTFFDPVKQGLSQAWAKQLEPVLWGKDQQSGIMGSIFKTFGLQREQKMEDLRLENGHVPVVIKAIDSGVLPGPGVLSGKSWPGGALTLQSQLRMMPGGAALMNMMGGGASSSPIMMAMGMGNPSVQSIAAGNGVEGGTSAQIANGGFAGGGTSGGQAGGLQGLMKSLGLSGAGGWKGLLGGIRRTPVTSTYGRDAEGSDVDTGQEGGKFSGFKGLAGAAVMAGGAYLAQRGLMGADRGTWGGVAEGTLGGAAVGLQLGGPLGAGIGALAGFGIGLGEKIAGVETPEREAKRLVKSTYGLDIDKSTSLQIAALRQKYGSVSTAIRSQEARDILQLYSDATGQKGSMFLGHAMSANLVTSNGSLQQAATYRNGTAYEYESPLPMYGPSGSTIPTGNPFQNNGQPTVVQMQVNGTSASDLLEGRATNAILGGSSRMSSASTLMNPNTLPY
jgi:hypothetical protein